MAKMIKSRRKTASSFLDKMKRKHLSQEDRELTDMKADIKRKISNPEKRLAYMKVMIEHCVVTCEVCEKKDKCDKKYEDCEYNPINGG